jgi:hypothetical protein
MVVTGKWLLKNPEKLRSEINHFYELLAATNFLQGLSSHVKVHYMIFLFNRYFVAAPHHYVTTVHSFPSRLCMYIGRKW